MAASAEVTTPTTEFSILNLSLKLDTAADLDAHLAKLTHPSVASSIKTIIFQGNTLGAPFCAALAPHLSTLHGLESANLADIFTARLITEIPPALDSLLTSFLPLQNLHTVNLSDNAFGLRTGGPLVSFLSQHTPLRHLILNNNGLGPEAGIQIANALTALATAQDAASTTGGKLETIVCGRNRLESGSMAAWARAVAAHGGALREVRMVQNGIRAEGVATLLRDGLARVPRVRVLDLQDNTFTSVAASVLARVMGEWKEIEELGVGDCLVGAKGFLAVTRALAAGSNARLAVLRCQYNDIDARGVAALADLVAGTEHEGAKAALPALRRVELNGNKFSEDDEAVERLREALEARRGGKEADGEDKDGDAEYGLDDLSDLEEASDEEDEDEEDENEEEEEEEDGDDEAKEDEQQKVQASIVKQADEAEAQNVALEKDKDVDALADRLRKTEL